MGETGDTTIERVKVRELAGVFRSREALDDAVDALLIAGFDRADVDLMAGMDTVIEKLGGTYVAVEELTDVPDTPRRAYTARGELVGPLATVAGILTFVGATAAALSVVASGGAVAVAAAAAAAGGAAGGGLGVALARSLGLKSARELETQLAEGGMVLWVRVRSPDREERAKQILADHGGDAIRVHEIEINKRLADVPLSSWLTKEPHAHG